MVLPHFGGPKEVTPTSAPLHKIGPPESPCSQQRCTRVHTSAAEAVMTGRSPAAHTPYLTGVRLVRPGTYHFLGDRRCGVVAFGARLPVHHSHVDRHQDVGQVSVIVCPPPSSNQTAAPSFWFSSWAAQVENAHGLALLCC